MCPDKAEVKITKKKPAASPTSAPKPKRLKSVASPPESVSPVGGGVVDGGQEQLSQFQSGSECDDSVQDVNKESGKNKSDETVKDIESNKNKVVEPVNNKMGGDDSVQALQTHQPALFQHLDSYDLGEEVIEDYIRDLHEKQGLTSEKEYAKMTQFITDVHVIMQDIEDQLEHVTIIDHDMLCNLRVEAFVQIMSNMQEDDDNEIV